MAPRKLIVIGGGEHARVVIDAARSRPDLWIVVGIIDPEPCTETAELLQTKRLGDDTEGLRLAGRADGPMFVIGVGSVGIEARRPAIAKRFALPPDRWAVIIHASAWVSPAATLGAGAVLLAGVIVNAGATTGKHAILNTACVIEHDVQVGSFAHVGPRAAIGGGTVIGDSTYLGLGSAIRDHVRVGHRVVVGMGAVVVGDVEDDQLVVGCPAAPPDKQRSESSNERS